MKKRTGIVGCRLNDEMTDRLDKVVKALNPDTTIVVCAVGGIPHSFADWACQKYGVPYLMHFVKKRGDFGFEKKILARNRRFVRSCTEFQFWWGDYDEDLHALWTLARRTRKPITMEYANSKIKKKVEAILHDKRGKTGRQTPKALQKPVRGNRRAAKGSGRSASSISRA